MSPGWIGRSGPWRRVPVDGANPEGRLIEHESKLYGTTDVGSATDSGTVFEVDPTTGTETVLYSFAGEPDAAFPYGGATYHDGKLFGDTIAGGASNWGAVYSLDLATGQERVLGSFNGPFADVSLGVQPGAELFYFRGVFYATSTFGFDGVAGGTIPACSANRSWHSRCARYSRRDDVRTSRYARPRQVVPETSILSTGSVRGASGTVDIISILGRATTNGGKLQLRNFPQRYIVLPKPSRRCAGSHVLDLPGQPRHAS